MPGLCYAVVGSAWVLLTAEIDLNYYSSLVPSISNLIKSGAIKSYGLRALLKARLRARISDSIAAPGA